MIEQEFKDNLPINSSIGYKSIMDSHISDFYSLKKGKTGKFLDVIALHEHPELTFAEAKAKAPTLTKGWYELSRLPVSDRIEFSCEFWLSKLPYQPKLRENLERFFSGLDDIGIILSQEKSDAPYETTMVYSLKNDTCFYRAAPPNTYEECKGLQAQFPEFIFPEDFIAFLQIHNGLHKTIDVTGLIPSQNIRRTYDHLQEVIKRQEPLKTRTGKIVDVHTFIPFYESFGLPAFQCFWGEWHHELGMGNVYLSLNERILADPRRGEYGPDNLAFSTFTDWLLFYLEPIG